MKYKRIILHRFVFCCLVEFCRSFVSYINCFSCAFSFVSLRSMKCPGFQNRIIAITYDILIYE